MLFRNVPQTGVVIRNILRSESGLPRFARNDRTFSINIINADIPDIPTSREEVFKKKEPIILPVFLQNNRFLLIYTVDWFAFKECLNIAFTDFHQPCSGFTACPCDMRSDCALRN